MVSSVEYLVIANLKELVDPTQRTSHQGELPLVEENLDSEGEDFHFPSEDDPDYNTDFNGEGEASLDLKEEKEEGDGDMAYADLYLMAQGTLTLFNNLHKMPKHL